MEKINQLISVLECLGYKPKHDPKKPEIYFTSLGSDSFPESHKNIVRILLGSQLSEFYYGGMNTQHIYYTLLNSSKANKKCRNSLQ